MGLPGLGLIAGFGEEGGRISPLVGAPVLARLGEGFVFDPGKPGAGGIPAFVCPCVFIILLAAFLPALVDANIVMI